MRGGTLKGQSLVLKRKRFGSGGNNGGVFEMKQDPFSGDQDDPRQAKRDKACKQMRHLFPGMRRHDKNTKVLSGLDAAIEFHFASLTRYGFLITLAAVSKVFSGIP
jgi:hypothetical protein